MDILSAILIAFAGIIGFLVYREWLLHRETVKKYDTTPTTPRSKMGIDLSYLDQALEAAEDDYNDAIAKGAKPEQLSKLKGHIDTLRWLKIGQPLIESAGKAIQKAIDGIGNIL